MELGKVVPEAGKALLAILFSSGEDTLTDLERESWQLVNLE